MRFFINIYGEKVLYFTMHRLIVFVLELNITLHYILVVHYKVKMSTLIYTLVPFPVALV